MFWTHNEAKGLEVFESQDILKARNSDSPPYGACINGEKNMNLEGYGKKKKHCLELHMIGRCEEP